MTEQLGVFKFVLTALQILAYCLANFGELFFVRYISGNSFWTILVNNLLTTLVNIEQGFFWEKIDFLAGLMFVKESALY